MNKFTEKELNELGFKSTHVTVEEWGGELPFTYYCFERPGICLISEGFDDLKTEVGVQLFEMNADKDCSREFILACVKEFGDD